MYCGRRRPRDEPNDFPPVSLVGIFEPYERVRAVCERPAGVCTVRSRFACTLCVCVRCVCLPQARPCVNGCSSSVYLCLSRCWISRVCVLSPLEPPPFRPPPPSQPCFVFAYIRGEEYTLYIVRVCTPRLIHHTSLYSFASFC